MTSNVADRFLLREYRLGLCYALTCGLFGVGWLYDLFRLKRLVRESNAALAKRASALTEGDRLAVEREQSDELQDKSLLTAYMYALPCAGLVGMHR